MEYFSPAMSVNSEMTDEELDKYFATYVPLSNLPTPPPAKEPQPKHQHAIAAATTTTTTSPPSREHQGMLHHIPSILPMSYFPLQDACPTFTLLLPYVGSCQGAHGPSVGRRRATIAPA
jgi:hypothetical protein